MKTYSPILGVICFILLMSACVSHKATYRSDWGRLPQIEDPYYTVYLIGDAGNTPLGESTKVFDHLKQQLDKEPAESAIIWLGDNIYPVGLAPTNSVYYAEGRHRLVAQLRTMIEFRGQKYFVPGNHDWYTYGRVGLRRQELLVDSFLLQTPNLNQQKNFFIPDKGCGDPKKIKLIDGISIILMDSHWFLNENARSGDQSVCDVQSTEMFLNKLQEEIKPHDTESYIIASHHPPYTYAHHGGKYPIKDDIFPLTQKVKWLFLPLPIAGYLFNRIRIRLSEQDVYHPQYTLYKSELIKILQNKGSSIVASGHEHTLQYIEMDNQHYIVSGSGTKKNKVKLGKGSQFAIGEKGYSKLIFKDSKNVVVQFIVPGYFEENNNIAFERLISLR